ncbi:hypothetical protein BDF19DRAFT_425755 [Syncephalis fuscata]|nr:hypothetical protein BDF19DRAFT_425755 [Syncephalis fuscata]
MRLFFNLSLISAALAVFLASSALAISSTNEPTPIRVLLGVGTGTKSHAAYFLAVCKELIARGHEVHFATMRGRLKWAADQPKIKLIDLGDTQLSHEERVARLNDIAIAQEKNPASLFNIFIKIIYRNYEWQYHTLRDIISGKSGDGGPMDVVMCDYFMRSCIDAAHSLDVSCVIRLSTLSLDETSNQPYLPIPNDEGLPTHEHSSFWRRFHSAIIMPLMVQNTIQPGLEFQASVLKKAGVKPYTGLSHLYDKSLIFVVTVPGYDQPRPVRPNVVYIGPALSDTYTPLTTELKDFLSTRSKTIFIGFGSIFVIGSTQFQDMIHSLVKAYHAGLIDGVVWGLMNTKADKLPLSVHTKVQTSTSIEVEEEHTLQDMQTGKHPFIYITNVAPQRALLNHPSVKIFISHCGSGSVHEAMDAGKPILAIPGFSDQLDNARKLASLGAAVFVKWNQVGTKVMHAAFQHLLEGESAEKARQAVAKLQKITRTYNRQLSHAADMVELAAVPGALKLLEPAGVRMDWWRARNVDVWIVTVLGLMSVLAGIAYTICLAYQQFNRTQKPTSHKFKKA